MPNGKEPQSPGDDPSATSEETVEWEMILTGGDIAFEQGPEVDEPYYGA